MKVIQRAERKVEQVLGRQVIESGSGVRFLTYCVDVPFENGILLYNLLTKELILLEDGDFCSDEAGLICPEGLLETLLLCMNEGNLYRYLVEHWFMVPQDNADRELCDNTRALLKHFAARKDKKGFTAFTILTTTDCNARCFYCYERGCEHVYMSPDTAEKTIDFICRNYENVEGCKRENGVNLSWFGGEPLCNAAVMDQISCGLRNLGVLYRSSMISNAYLFDDEMVKRAVDNWNLCNVQVTLDGTEEIYNRRKAYIYEDGGSAFIRVMENIERLLEAGIAVSVRMNLDEENFEDLVNLTDLLAERFVGYKKFSAYPRYLFNTAGQPLRGEADLLSRRMLKLQERMRSVGFLHQDRLPKSLKMNRCMADNDRSVLIMADGSLGRCEHYFDSRICGNVEEGILDFEETARWKVRKEPFEICGSCPNYPDCYMLRECPGAYDQACKEVPALREDKLQSLRRAILSYYERTKKREEESLSLK